MDHITLTIDNSKESAVTSEHWKNPGAKLYDQLLNAGKLRNDDETKWESNWEDYLKEAYLVAPVKSIKNSPYGVTPFSRSGCKYPHHEIKGEKLVVNIAAVKAAYARAKQQKDYRGELAKHLDKHRRELGLIDNPKKNELAEAFDESSKIEDLQEINDPQNFLKWMDCIQYGWKSKVDGEIRGTGENDDENLFYKGYYLQNPKDLPLVGYGVCWDQIELERVFFHAKKIPFKIFYIELTDSETRPTHTFLLFTENEKVYWFEHSWGPYKGIHEFETQSQAIHHIANLHRAENNMKGSMFFVNELEDVPKYGCSCQEFMEYARKQPRVLSNMRGRQSVMKSPEDVTQENFNDIEEFLGENIPEFQEALNTEAFFDEKMEAALNPEMSYEEFDEEFKYVETTEEDDDNKKPSKNGARRRVLYIKFMEWCKEFNVKNTFGNVFDKDVFEKTYPFVPYDMRYFYRLANPMLCVLPAGLTFFALTELKKLNAKNPDMNKLLIFAATPSDLRVFNTADRKVYRGIIEEGDTKITLSDILGDSFDLYLQRMINKGDILNAE